MNAPQTEQPRDEPAPPGAAETAGSNRGCVVVGNLLLVGAAAALCAAYFAALHEYRSDPTGGMEFPMLGAMLLQLSVLLGICLLIAWGSKPVRSIPWLRWVVVVGVALAFAAPLSCAMHEG